MEIPSWDQFLQVAAAARLRKAGNDWEVVARMLGCPEEVCREWPTQYPVWWASSTQRAQEERLRGIWADLERAWREDLRSGNARRRRQAAGRILRAARRHRWAMSAEAKAEAERVRAAEGAGR